MIDLKNTIIFEDMTIVYKSRDDWKELENATIYITGAGGMIASYLTEFLIYLNEYRGFHIDIYAGVRKRDKAYARFGFYTDKSYFHIIEADVIQQIDADKYDFDYIIHAASPASPQYYGLKPVETMLPNTVGTYQLLNYTTRHKIKSFLYFSSGSIYGDIDGHIGSVSEEAVGTLDFLYPGNCYGESKRCGEALCGAYFREYSTPVKMARIFHSYGPTMDWKNDKRSFAEFIKNALEGTDIVLKSDGTSKRAFCYMTDTLSALFRILLDGDNGESYNLANVKEYIMIAELAEIVGELAGNVRVVKKERKINQEYCPAASNETFPDCNKLKTLGWLPQVSVREGFDRTYKYLKSEISQSGAGRK